MCSALYLIRHGETPWTLTKQHTGRTDIPLTPTGLEQAEKLRLCLEGIAFAHVFTSPALRARQTCERAGFAQCFPEPLIEEWDYGEFEGKTKIEIHKSWPGWNVFRHGCPGGEKPEDLMERADEVITRLSRLEGTVALFSHGHFLRVLTTRWLAWPLTHAQPLVFGPASVSVLGYEGAERALILWNRAGQDSPPKPRT